ncbi:MAG TPA: hypothetical protein VLY04_25945 [Bryobacteraceae bacterium]|nr:hypothetical protein [Bryobacteraceae bacterium]
MTPETQPLFSVTLYLALCSLLAWSNRRNRHARHFRATVAAVLVGPRDEWVETD